MRRLKIIFQVLMLISFVLLLSNKLSALHKFYLSITKIEPSNDQKKLECTLKLFGDDLELALENESGIELNLEIGEPKPMEDSLMSRYVKGHFSLSQNGKKNRATYIGAEIEEDLVWIYLEYNKPKEGSYLVKNNCLMELFEEQNNIIHVVKNGKTSSAIFNINDYEEIFEF